MAALLDGIYDGDLTIAELLTHGDFGLGTFNHLDGTCYHLRADGSATIASGQDKTPFAAVVWFRPDKTINIKGPSDRAALTGLIDSAIPSPNLTYALRVSGSFAHVRTRTVMAQQPPYPPLTEATAHEPVTDLEHVTGTLAGFRTSAYESAPPANSTSARLAPRRSCPPTCHPPTRTRKSSRPKAADALLRSGDMCASSSTRITPAPDAIASAGSNSGKTEPR
jgi:hypothetical protein